MSNNYGAFAAITVDAAGTEHAVWEHQGLLWHTYFDENADQWVDADPISNADGGSDLQLLAGDFVPYVDDSEDTQYAPGLVAAWENDSGDLFYIIGRYAEDGKIQWSEQVEFGVPDLNQGETVLSQDPQIAITPEIISQGGDTTPPAIAAVYQILDSTTEYIANWRDNNNDYLINFRFTGDPGDDGILSGRGTNNSLGDGVTNELTSWMMEVFDTDGLTLLAKYDLSDQLLFDKFNFNFGTDNSLILANADAETFSAEDEQYGLNVGLDETVGLPTPQQDARWKLASQANTEEIILERDDNGDISNIASSELSSTIFPVSSSASDDTDLYSEFIAFSGDAATGDTLTDTNGNTVTFVPEPPISPRYDAAGPENQFLTADTINSANKTPTSLGDSVSTLATTPLGTTQGFSISFASTQRVIAGNVPLPASLISTNSNVGIQISGSIGAVETVTNSTENNFNSTKAYVAQTSLSLGTNSFKQNTLDSVNSNASKFANATTVQRNGNQLSINLGINSTFIPDTTGELQFSKVDLVITLALGQFFQFRLSIPGTPKNLANAILQGDLQFSYLNFQGDIDVGLEPKSDADQLPIYIEGNANDPSSIQLVNTTITNWLSGEGTSDGFAASQAVTEILTRLSQTAPAEGSLGDPTFNGIAQKALFAEEVILGLLYAIQVVEQAGYLLANTDQYSFEDFDISFEYLPFLNGSVKAFFDTLSASASGSLSIGGDLEIFEGGDTVFNFDATESFSASANLIFWKWSWSEKWTQELTIGTPPSSTPQLGDDQNNSGDVAVIYSPTPGSNKLYQDTGAVRSDLSDPTAQTLNDLTDDDDTILAFDPFSGSVLLAWVAAGNDSEKPLGEQTDNVVSRVFSSSLDGSERGWEIPDIVNQDNELIKPGFNFNPSAEFFYTETSTGEIVDPSTIDISSGLYTLNRMLAWGFSETARGLNANSTPQEVQDAVQATEIFYSLSTRPAAGGSWTEWSAPALVSEQSGTDILPTLGQDPDGTLRLAWVSSTTENDEPLSIIYTSTWDGSSWSDAEIVVQQSDLRVSKLILDTFDDQPAIYWTDDIDLSYSAFVLQDDPGWYYRLNDSGSNVAENLGNLGSSYNATYATTADGTITILNDSALQNPETGDGDPDASAEFDAIGGGFLSIPVGQNNLGASFSLELWVKFDNTDADQILLQKILSATEENPDPTADWILKTGGNNNLIFDVGSGEISYDQLTTDEWHYVVATFDSTVNGTSDNPIAALYVDGIFVGQQQGAANPITESTITVGEGLTGLIDELAIYNRLLATSPDVTTDSSGNVTNYNPGITGEGAITTHYNARFNPTENVVGDGTFFAVYDADTDIWSEINRFAPNQELNESEPLLQRAPTYDIVSKTALEPDSETDLYTQISITKPNGIIQAIQVTGPEGSIWSTNWTTDSHLPLAIVQDGLLINDDDGFEKTLLGITETFDLYFQGTSETGDYSIEVIFSDKTTSNQKQPLLPNPSQSAAVGNIVSAQGDIIEKEVTEFAQIDSGLTLDTSEDYVGTTMIGGNFLDGATAIAVAAPFTNSGDGVILVLTAGADSLKSDNDGSTLDPSKIPSDGNGVLINGVSGAQEQAGFSLAVGDINKDGTDDLVIGAPRSGDDNNGSVYVVSGKVITSGATINLEDTEGVYKISGFDANSEGGYALSTGDLDNDDFIDDILIGSPFAANGNGDENSGKVYVVYGSEDFGDTTISDETNLVFTGEGGSVTGFSVDVIPSNISHSFNSDTLADVVIGAPQYSQDVTFNDDFENNDAPQDTIDAVLTAATVLPDNNNTSGSNTIELTTGRVYVLFGQSDGIETENTESSLNGNNGFILDGSSLFNSDAEAGYSVSGAGDINSDGFEDVIIGAPSEGKGTGQVYVVGGRSDFSQYDSTPLPLAWESNLIITGPEPHAKTGTIVSDAGDFNANKADDIVIGSPQAGYSAGQAHILFGNKKESENPLWSDDYSTVFSLVPGSTQSIATFNESGNTTPDPNISTFLLNGTNPKDGVIPSRGATDLNGDEVDDLLASSQLANQVGILFGHPWLSDEGSLKLKDLTSDQGFIVGGEIVKTGIVELNGTNESLELKGYEGISGTDPRTVEAWIKVTSSATGNQPIIAWGENSPTQRWTIRLDNGQLRAEVDGGFIKGSSNLLDDQWHHVAVTWEDDGSPNITDAILYVDGQLETIADSTSESIATSNQSNVTIGTTFGDAYFNGELDEVRIWSEVRS